MNWRPGYSVDDYNEEHTFCYEPNLKDVQQQMFYEQSAGKMHLFEKSPNYPQPSAMGWTHQQKSTVQGWRASSSSSSKQSTYNNSKNNLSKPSSSSNNLSLSKASTKSSRYHTQPEALPIKDHGPKTVSISPPSINSVMYSSKSYQHIESLSQLYDDSEGIVSYILGHFKSEN